MIAATHLLPLVATVAPDDQAAVGDVIRRASETGTPIYPIGGGTAQDYGALPVKPGVGLSLAQLNRVVDYPARDLTITVEAGITVAELRRQLAGERQRLPVDVAEAERATVGGVVARSPSGPRRFRWGTMRDYVIGVQAIDGCGRPFSGGGRVVKNAAGYDLCRLMTGSLGTLGVITQVTLMVRPVPESSLMVGCEVADHLQAERLLADLVHAPVLPSAVELLAGPGWDKEPLLSSPASSFGRLWVAFEGTAAEVAGMAETLQARWHELGIELLVSGQPEQTDRLWQRLVDSFASRAEDSREATVVEIRVLPSALVGTCRLLRTIDPAVSLQAHAGDGIVQAEFSVEPREVLSILDDRFRSSAKKGCEVAVVVRGSDEARRDRRAVWGPASDSHQVMLAIKNRFDPQGILNPGRFVF